MRSTLGFGGLGLILVFVAACGAPAGQAGEAVRPKAGTGTDALGEANVAACAKALVGEPLVVDLKSSERSDLEVAMKEGVVVVGFDCKSLKIVKGCSAAGSYRFAGVTRKEDVVRMQSQDELAANLPLTGAKLSADLKRGSTLDLALVTVGKKRASAAEIVKSDLTGSCEGATHIVRGVYIGAFALMTGTEGQARAVAQIFGAGASAASASGKKTEARDGDLEACRKSTPDATSPPEQCAAITRLELVPIVAEKTAKKEGEAKDEGGEHAEIACPQGFAWDGAKCVGGRKSAVKACDRNTGAKEECGAACDAGSAESCFNLAVYTGQEIREVKNLDGSIVKVRYGNPKPDIELVEKSCSMGFVLGCQRAAFLHSSLAYRQGATDAEKKAETAKSHKLYSAACDLGDASSCMTLASHFDPNMTPLPGLAPSADKFVAFTRRACDLGAGYACGRVGDLHRDGKGVKEDSALAIAAYERQCASGGYSDGDGCYKIGAIYANGKGLAADPAKALTYFDRACGLRNMYACTAGVELATKAGDTTRARSMLERGCSKDVRGWDTCLALGEALEKGTMGLQKDYAKAAEAYELGCAKGACGRAGDLYKSGGPNLPPSPEKALHAYTQGCLTWSEAKACAGEEALLKTKGKDELAKFYQLRCENRGDARSCLRWKTVGGKPSEETMTRYVDMAKMGCQKLHYGDECKLWKELGGAPTAAELAQPVRGAKPATPKKK